MEKEQELKDRKVDISFDEIKRRLNNINLPDFDLIVGIASGGIVPSSLVAFISGKELSIMELNYRDENNNPRYDAPKLLNDFKINLSGRKILLVDDVSVTGKTLDKAKSFLTGNEIYTFTFKGKSDYVLFPEIKSCVNWPWKKGS